MNKRKALRMVTGFLCCLLLGGMALAMSSDNYRIDWDVIAGGGGRASSAGHTLRSTIGQTAIGPSSSANFQLGAGYWYGVRVPVLPTPTATPTSTSPHSPTPTNTPKGTPTSTSTPTPTPTNTPTATPTSTPTPTGPEVKILNPQPNTWYRLTRAIDLDGEIYPFDETLPIELEAIGYPPGGSYKWTISAVDTRFDEPSLVNITWLSSEKISLTWDIPPWPCWEPYPWSCPCSFVPPLPCPFPDWPEPWFFSYSMLNITCEYTPPGASPVKDSVNAVVEYGIAGEQSTETLIYGEDIAGIGNHVVALSYKENSDKYSKVAEGIGYAVELWGIRTHNIWVEGAGWAWGAGTCLGEIIGNLIWKDSPLPAINPYMDVNQSDTYMEPWSIISRTAMVVDILPPPPENDFAKAVLNALEKTIDVDDVLEALRVTYYRERWAEKVGDEDALRLQQQMFMKFFTEYIRRSQKLQAALYKVVDELEKIGDIYISPENISDFQAELWTEGFSPTEMQVFELYDIYPWVKEYEKRELCLYSSEKQSGYLSTKLINFIEEIREGDQKLIDILLEYRIYLPLLLKNYPP